MEKKVHFIGVGTGWGASNRGTAAGPKYLFENSHSELSLSFQEYFKPAALSLIDAHEGDNSFFQSEIRKSISFEQQQEKVQQINQRLYNLILESFNGSYFPVVIGGDHSLATATWSAVRRAHRQSFGLIWIDAHLDAHTFLTSPSKAMHGMPVSSLLGYGPNPFCSTEPPIQPENLIYLGARSYEPEELNYLKERNVQIFFTQDCNQQTVARLYSQAVQTFVQRNLKYGVSLDIDVIDPLEAPGTGALAPQGLAAQDLVQALHGCLHDPSLLAFELVEYNPYLDQHSKTHHLMWLLLDSLRKKNCDDHK